MKPNDAPESGEEGLRAQVQRLRESLDENPHGERAAEHRRMIADYERWLALGEAVKGQG